MLLDFQARDHNLTKTDVKHPGIGRWCHSSDHAAELNEVGDEKVDDVDRSNIIISYLQENIGKSKQTVVNMF